MKETVVAAILRRNGRILITRRLSYVHLPGLWEFPGGKVELEESLQQALHREIAEELGVTIDVHDRLFKIEHRYPSRVVHLYFFNCSLSEGDPKPIGVAALTWVRPSELDRFQFPEANRELIARLQRLG